MDHCSGPTLCSRKVVLPALDVGFTFVQTVAGMEAITSTYRDLHKGTASVTDRSATSSSYGLRCISMLGVVSGDSQCAFRFCSDAMTFLGILYSSLHVKNAIISGLALLLPIEPTVLQQEYY